MTLGTIWNSLVKRWWLILVCFLIGGIGAFAGSKLITPLYQSTAVVQVAVVSSNNSNSSNNSADYNNLLASGQLIQTEAALAISDPVLSEVASHYPGLTAEQLAGEVIATVKASTQLFQIDVLDPSPTRAAALADSIATTLIEQQTQSAQQGSSKSQQQIQQDLRQTQQQINSTMKQITALEAIKKGNQQAQIDRLNTQLAGLQQHLSQQQSMLAQLQLAQTQSANFLAIVQHARPALKPARPNVPLNTASGLITGLLLGLLLAVLLELLDTRVRTAEALTQLVNWPILAAISRVDATKEAIVNPPERSANIEAYRMLRTNIGFSLLDKPLQSIMVTSAVPKDGKSTVAANLAIFMAKAGKKTLLIDADLHRPTMTEKFQFPAGTIGLTNAVVACSQLHVVASTPLLPTLSLDPYMHTVGIPNLLVMPSGPLPPNPPELLDSKAMDRFFVAIASCGAEVVIFDTPPLLGLSDTSILASKVAATIVVTDITRANKKNLKRVKELLTQTGTTVLGCVINKQIRGRKDETYSYYYSYPTEEVHPPMKNGNVSRVPPSRDLAILANQPSMASYYPTEEGPPTMKNGNVPPSRDLAILANQPSMASYYPIEEAHPTMKNGNAPSRDLAILANQQSIARYYRTEEAHPTMKNGNVPPSQDLAILANQQSMASYYPIEEAHPTMKNGNVPPSQDLAILANQPSMASTFPDTYDPKQKAQSQEYEPGESSDDLKKIIDELTAQNEILKRAWGLRGT